MEEVQGEAVVEQSAVLTEEEVTQVVDTPEGEEVSLPSDEVAFEVPEKFQGKSIEDVIKSYQELEKFKGKTETEEGGDTTLSKEEDSKEPSESKEISKEKYNEYLDSYNQNGELSEDQYAELAGEGYTKDQVDEEIEFSNFKKQREINKVIEPLGGGQEKFKAVSDWANENKSKEDLVEFNAELKASGKLAQQAMMKNLYAEYDASSGEKVETVLHTNTPQTNTSKGYTSEAEFFKDISSKDYGTHKSFAKAVEAKLAKTDTTGWAIG